MVDVKDSILQSTKKLLNVDPEVDVFDMEIQTHINSAFMTLQQLGVGPKEGFAIDGEDAVWSSYLGSDLNLNSVKTYIYIKVRLIFDVPGTSYVIKAFEDQAKELEWRLTHQMDPPLPPKPPEDDE